MTTPPSSPADLFADEVVLDAYPVYEQLRELGPVVYLPKNDVYALTRYDVLRHALLTPGEYSSAQGVGFNDAVNGALQGTSLASDPPVHTQLRAALSENLTPRKIRYLADTIQDRADRLVVELVAEGSFDAMDKMCRAFPLDIVADLIGFSDEIKSKMLRWGEAANEVIGPFNHRTEENFPIAGELYGWCTTVKAEDLAEGSVGRGVFEAEAQGVIPEGSSGHIIHQYLGAGVGNLVSSLGNMVALFARHPEQFAKVQENPDLVPNAFEEATRYWSPIQTWARVATGDLDVEGLVIPAGSRIALLFGSGNRDPRHFEDPDAFDVTRANAGDHISFGLGPHGCAGQNIARMIGHALGHALVKHASRIVTAEPVVLPKNVNWSIDRLDVREVVPA